MNTKQNTYRDIPVKLKYHCWGLIADALSSFKVDGAAGRTDLVTAIMDEHGKSHNTEEFVQENIAYAAKHLNSWLDDGDSEPVTEFDKDCGYAILWMAIDNMLSAMLRWYVSEVISDTKRDIFHDPFTDEDIAVLHARAVGKRKAMYRTPMGEMWRTIGLLIVHDDSSGEIEAAAEILAGEIYHLSVEDAAYFIMLMMNTNSSLDSDNRLLTFIDEKETEIMTCYESMAELRKNGVRAKYDTIYALPSGMYLVEEYQGDE